MAGGPTAPLTNGYHERTPVSGSAVPAPATVALATAGLALAIGLALLAYSAWLRGRPFTISLSTSQDKTEHFELAALDEALVLEAPPFCGHASHTASAPSITVSWRGPI